MTEAELERCCLALAGASKDFPFGTETAVFRVGGKIFARTGAQSGRVNLKCEPAVDGSD